MRSIIRATVIFLGLIGTCLAADQDSVLNPDLGVSVQSAYGQAGSSAGPATTYTTVNEYHYGTCPSGFTYGGSTQYPTEVRTDTTYYMGGVQVGQSTSPWYDLDADCTTTEYQEVACPSGYTGVYYQSRQVATSDGDSLQYGDWQTYGDSCVQQIDLPTACSRAPEFAGYTPGRWIQTKDNGPISSHRHIANKVA